MAAGSDAVNRAELQNPFFRTDLLTGCSNLVGFSEAIDNDFGNRSRQPLSLVAVDACNLKEINKVKGRAFGDSLLSWFGFAIKDITRSNVYRITGDDFVAVMIGETHEMHAQKARQLYKQLNENAKQFGLNSPIARLSVFHFPLNQPSDATMVWKYLNEKHNFSSSSESFKIIHIDETLKLSYDTAHAIVLMSKRITDLGYMLENTFGLAYTDPISGSPNMIAIQHKLDLALREAAQQDRPLSVCLVDGDDLRRYNSVGYAAGDDIIRKLNATLAAVLRPEDFLGRWRMGDEFIVILPDTNSRQASAIGERLRAAVERASQRWLYPTTISVGVASFPAHGQNTMELLLKAEQFLKSAKEAGKNKVVTGG
ncbi:MAG: hypothetical protein B6D40_12035 [Anaerolineae bacterium UTCFX3]|jgi:diguanylate cyclase (GGDEF)-like protein|nr:MAG: hypothetical protein B6D40_12035 [Anaerolineae bacterium UTCFX3]